MEIIVTGATGFVGKNLIPFFKNKQYNVIPVSLRNEEWKRKFTTNAQAVIHLAGIAHDLEGKYKEDDYFKINTQLTQAVFEQFLQSPIKDFIFFSTTNVVGDQTDKELKETCVPNPLTAYGRSKLEAEQYLLAQKLPEGKRLFIIRPCMIHGPGNKGNLNLLYKVVEKRIPWPLTQFENQRSFLGIDNLCFLVEQMLLNRNIPSGIYNFADDQSLSTNELIQVIGDNIGHQVKFLNISRVLFQKIGKFGDVLHLPFNSERLQKVTESYVVSNLKIKQALGITDLPYTVTQGMEKTIKSFNKKTTL